MLDRLPLVPGESSKGLRIEATDQGQDHVLEIQVPDITVIFDDFAIDAHDPDGIAVRDVRFPGDAVGDLRFSPELEERWAGGVSFGDAMGHETWGMWSSASEEGEASQEAGGPIGTGGYVNEKGIGLAELTGRVIGAQVLREAGMAEHGAVWTRGADG